MAISKHSVRYPAEMKSSAVKRVKNGETYASVARSIGVSEPTVSSWAKAVGIKSKHNSHHIRSEKVKRAIIERAEAGESMLKIAKSLGLPDESVRRIVRLSGSAARSKRRFSEDEIAAVVQRYLAGEKPALIQADAGCSRSAMLRWVKDSLASTGPTEREQALADAIGLD